MNSNFLRINWLEIKEAIAVAIVTFLLTIIIEIIAANTIFGLEWKTIINNAIISALAFFGTFLKSLFTTNNGILAGVKVK